jgi:filamentous hemagglutinin family protein
MVQVAEVSKIVVFTLTMLIIEVATANPVGGEVAAGNATISQSGNTTTINQGSQQAILKWQSFNIKNNETTHFQQPANGVALNRINPQQGASQIYGALTATGKIILINSAGIHFGPTAMVNVGSIIASTADISNANFLKNKFIFDQPSPTAGSIINEGTINTADYGLVALLGTGVVNSGNITANMGSIVMGAGNKFTLDFNGDQLINFTVDEETQTAGVDQNGKKLTSGASNTGEMIADGGQILVSARVAKNVLDKAVNMEGIAQANSVSAHEGVIILSGGEGTVEVSGQVVASSVPAKLKHKLIKQAKSSKGGLIEVLGKEVVLTSTASLDASGTNGGGNIFIGGNEHGEGKLQNAATTTVQSGATLNASALENGNGGNIIVWSDKNTYFGGSLQAQGGANSGNGGFSEISGHDHLSFVGGHVNLLAAAGKNGQLLLDPRDVTISTDPSTPPTIGTGTYVPTSDDSVVNVTDLVNALNGADVTITTGTTGTQTGDITVNTEIDWNNNSLSFTAAHSIILNANLNNMGSGNMNFNSPVTLGSDTTLTSGGQINFGSTATIDGGVNLILMSSAITLGANVGSTTLLTSLILEDTGSGSSGADTVASAIVHTTGALSFQSNATFTNAAGVSITSDNDIVTFGFVNDFNTIPPIFGEDVFSGTNNVVTGNQVNYYANIDGSAGKTVNFTTHGTGSDGSRLYANMGMTQPFATLDFEGNSTFQILNGNVFSASTSITFNTPLNGVLAKLTADPTTTMNFTTATINFNSTAPIQFSTNGQYNSYNIDLNISGVTTWKTSGSADVLMNLNLNTGTLNATSADAFNNMTLNAASGTVTTITQNQSGSTGTVINLAGDNNGTNQLTFNNTGAIDLASGITINLAHNTGINFAGTGGVTFDAMVTGDVLNKNGSDTLILTNSGNNFSNANINAGKATITQGSALGSGDATVSSAILESDGNNTFGQNISISGASTLQTGSGGDTFEISGQVNGPGDLTLAGPGTITIDGDIGGGQQLSTITSTSSTPVIFAGSQTNTSGNQTFNNTVTLNSAFTFNAGGIIQVNGAVSTNGSNVTFNGATTQLLSGSNNFNLGNVEIQSGVLDYSINGSLGGASNITTDSGATFNMSTDLTTLYTDFTNNGTLEIDSGTRNINGTGQIDTLGTMNIANGATLNVHDSLSNSGTLNGGGTVITTDLPGTAVINAGTWQLTGDNGVSSVTVNSGGTLNLQTDNFTGSMTLAGTGAGGAGALAVGASQTIQNATITTNSSALISVGSGATLTIGQAGNPTNFTGTGTLTLGGAGAYSLAAGDASNLANLTVSSPITIDGSQFTATTSGAQTYNALVTLVNDTTFTGNVAFNQGLSGNTFNVTLTGSGNNSYTLAGNLGVNSITVNGNGSGNTLAVKSQSGEPLTWTVSGTDSGSVTGITELVTPPLAFNTIQNITGSDNGDTFVISGGTLAGMILGGSGNNTIVGDNVANTWNITGSNAGNLTGVNSFASIQNLTGGTAGNNFVFANNAGVSGTVNGNSSSNNSVDVSASSSSVTVNVTADQQGTASLTDGLAQIADFMEIQNVTGNGDSTLNAAANKANTITLTSASSGTIADPMTFSGFNVFGNSGSGTTTVAFAPGTTVVFISPNMATVNGSTVTFNDISNYTGTYTPFTPGGGGGGGGGGGNNGGGGNGGSATLTQQVILNNAIATIISAAINGVNTLYGPSSGASPVSLALQQFAVLSNYIGSNMFDFEFASDQLGIHYLQMHPIHHCYWHKIPDRITS